VHVCARLPMQKCVKFEHKSVWAFNRKCVHVVHSRFEPVSRRCPVLESVHGLHNTATSHGSNRQRKRNQKQSDHLKVNVESKLTPFTFPMFLVLLRTIYKKMKKKITNVIFNVIFKQNLTTLVSFVMVFL